MPYPYFWNFDKCSNGVIIRPFKSPQPSLTKELDVAPNIFTSTKE